MDNALEPPTQSAASKWVYWGREMHICVGKLTIIGSDNGLSPDRRQAIIWTNDEILLIGPLGTNFSEILIAILTLSFKKMRLKVSSVKRRPFCLGLNVLISDIQHLTVIHTTPPAPTKPVMGNQSWGLLNELHGIAQKWCSVSRSGAFCNSFTQN